MGKNVLVISGSPRKNGNTSMLCESFCKGAAEAGNSVEMISLAGKEIAFCTACYACHNGGCPKKDDAPEIVEKMLKADVIVLGTPVYFYTMSAQLKALIDRSVMVYPKIEKKEFYFLMAMADTEEENFTGTIEALRGFVACCENSVERGIITAPGVYEAGEIAGHPALVKAYEAGKGIK
jgi:multimeric flavodoxin WrbA